MSPRGPFRVGVGGPVGSGKTALIEALVPRLVARGRSVVIITNDILTREDEWHVKTTLAGVLAEDRVVGVQTGTCPHAAVREDSSMNLAALEELGRLHPGTDYAFVESGGDNLTLTFSPELVDRSVFVIDVAGGDKIPRKRGPGLVNADLLVVNKTDLAPHVGASLEVFARDADSVRADRPTLFTDCRHGQGLDAVIEDLESARRAWVAGTWDPSTARERATDATDATDHAHPHPHVHAPVGDGAPGNGR